MVAHTVFLFGNRAAAAVRVRAEGVAEMESITNNLP